MDDAKLAGATLLTVGGVCLICGAALTLLSFAWDCDALVERWERAEAECREQGHHWRSRPAEEFCDGSLMIAPHGECWDDVGLDVHLGGGE